jgi:hypothetical protein
VLQDTLGFILIILILLEFNHSIWVALTERSGAIQVRILVRITIRSRRRCPWADGFIANQRSLPRTIAVPAHGDTANAFHVLSTRRGPRLALTLGRAAALAMAAVSASRGNATVT